MGILFVQFILFQLTHWGRVTHKCVSKLITIGSDNGLSPGWRRAIIWTNAAILLIGHLRTNFSEIPTEISISSFKKTNLKMSYRKWRPFCLGFNGLTALNNSQCIAYVLLHWYMRYCSNYKQYIYPFKSRPYVSSFAFTFTLYNVKNFFLNIWHFYVSKYQRSE